MRPDEQGHIVLEFGHRAGGTEPGVPLDPAAAFVLHERVLMPREAAQRMVDGLARVLGRPLALLASPAAAVSGPSGDADALLRQRGTTPRNAPPDPAGETAAFLMNAVRELAPGHYQERSFRIAPQSLQANRFLLSINARQLPADVLERSWKICRQLGLPATLRQQLEAAFAWGDHVHFGFEGEHGRAMCKLYLERTLTGLEAARAADSGEPALQYLAFKWNVATGEHVVSRYHWHVGLSASGIEQRIAQLCGAQPGAMLEMARAVLNDAAARLPPQRLLYIEVTEEGQPRSSFDLNLYDARMLVRDQQSVLFAMRDYFGVRPGQFQALYDQIKSRPFGHLAGGVHRNGQEFFNVYFGGTRPG